MFQLIELFWSTWEVTITERQADEEPVFLLAKWETCFTVSRTYSGPVLSFYVVWSLLKSRTPVLTLYGECRPNQICSAFPWKHSVLPELEINYDQGLSNQVSILKAVRVAIFESAAVEDALITAHFSSVILMRLIHFAFFLWARKSGCDPGQTTSEWMQFIMDWNAAWRVQHFMNVELYE